MMVASYCRVSTDQEDQANSFEAQQRYFREYILRHPDWTLYEVYADEGITGTSTRKRTQFNRMIQDAHRGKFSLILTKEVSRFSRNILDTIAYTRELKAIGVGVQFMLDGIHTLQPEAEMYLSIMASMAQEESRKTSSRVVWGQTRQMERGVVFGRSMLGYRVTNGTLRIEPEGAELVRLIFHKYAIEQVGTTQLARFLTESGCRTSRGSTQWRPNTVIKLLKNEKYVGDLVQKKTYTPDFLTHEKRRNTGQVPLIRIENHHEPIISRELWDLTQERLRRNDKHQHSASTHSNRYPFSGKIQCGSCGSGFTGRCKRLKDGTKSRRWSCSKGCGVGKTLRDDDALQMLKTAVSRLSLDTDAIARTVTDLAMDAILAEEAGASENAQRLTREIERTLRKKELLLDSFLEGSIPKPDMLAMNAGYDARLASLRDRLSGQSRRPDPQELRTDILKEVTALLNGRTESDAFCKNLLERITVFPDRHLELTLNNLPIVFHFE